MHSANISLFSFFSAQEIVHWAFEVGEEKQSYKDFMDFYWGETFSQI